MILVTHTDLDGIGCEIVALWFYEDEINEVYRCDYDKVDSLIRNLLQEKQDKILITDIAINEDTAKFIEENNYGERVMVVDHHKTSLSYLQNKNWAIINLDYCATKNLLNYLLTKIKKDVPENLEKFVYHVNDYDLWIHESPISKNFNDMLYLLGKNTFKKIIYERIKKGMELISECDKVYLEGLQEKKIEYFKKKVKKAKVVGNRIVVIASRYISELSQYIRDIEPPTEEWKKADYIDVLNFESFVHALRSYNPDFDVSEIAKKFGGGGHPKAAGYPMKIDENFIIDYLNI